MMTPGVATTTPYTAEMAEADIARRREERRVMGRELDAALRRVEGVSEVSASTRGRDRACARLQRFLRSVGRRLPCMSVAEVGVVDAQAQGASRSMLGLGSSKNAATEKLEHAAAAMRQRVAVLEQRAQQERAESVRLARAGQKPAALRMLKKAKATEASLASNADALLGVEMQADMLAQAEMQKQLSSALASSSKAMKSDIKVVAKAEKAIDDAQDARDTATDLGHAMTEFANAAVGDTDDDDLMFELEEMMAEDPPLPPAPAVSAAVLAPSSEQGFGALPSVPEEASCDVSDFPAAPRRPVAGRAAKREENTRLLAESSVLVV